MVMINRVYTRKGDGGETALVGGRAVSKDHLRVECYGTVDELNSVLGVVRHFNAGKPQSARRDGLEVLLQTVQQRLFDLGAELATHPDDRYEGQVTLSKEDVRWLEAVIDAMNGELPALKSFVLPGGGAVSAFLHQARTVCRRAERVAVALARDEEVGPQAIAYLNRLSDALFVWARWVGATMGEQEILWQPGLAADDSWRKW